MNYGLYLSAAGALTSLHRQDVIANNLANVETAAFKPDQVFVRQRLPERLENPARLIDAREMLERLGGGTLLEPTRTLMRQGQIVSTDNPLDVAVRGEGLLAYATRDERGVPAVRFSRDGRLAIDEQRRLVSVTTALPVLDRDDRPIVVDPAADVEIRGDGSVRQGGEVVAMLQLVTPPDPADLRKVGHGLLAMTPVALARRAPATGEIRQHAYEASAVDPIMALNAMVGAAKATQANARMMQYHDHIMGQAINTMGRVA